MLPLCKPGWAAAALAVVGVAMAAAGAAQAPPADQGVVHANREQRMRNGTGTLFEIGSLPPAIAPVGAPALSRLAGRFRTVPGSVIEVRAHGEFLSLGENPAGVPVSVPFYPQSETAFTGFHTQGASLAELRFEVRQNAMTRLVVRSRSGSATATRLP